MSNSLRVISPPCNLSASEQQLYVRLSSELSSPVTSAGLPRGRGELTGETSGRETMSVTGKELELHPSPRKSRLSSSPMSPAYPTWEGRASRGRPGLCHAELNQLTKFFRAQIRPRPRQPCVGRTDASNGAVRVQHHARVFLRHIAGFCPGRCLSRGDAVVLWAHLGFWDVAGLSRREFLCGGRSSDGNQNSGGGPLVGKRGILRHF